MLYYVILYNLPFFCIIVSLRIIKENFHKDKNIGHMHFLLKLFGGKISEHSQIVPQAKIPISLNYPQLSKFSVIQILSYQMSR